MTDDLTAMFGDVSTKSESAGYWFTPERLARIRAVHTYLEGLPEIGKVLSLASVVRVAERINEGVEFTADDLGALNRDGLAGVRNLGNRPVRVDAEQRGAHLRTHSRFAARSASQRADREKSIRIYASNSNSATTSMRLPACRCSTAISCRACSSRKSPSLGGGDGRHSDHSYAVVSFPIGGNRWHRSGIYSPRRRYSVSWAG